MNNYYLRQIELWGEETQALLKDKTIAIIGAGGLGSSIGISLSGSGIGEIYIVDFDKVSTSNIHRQIAFTTKDVGKSKAEVLANLLTKRNPYISSKSIIGDFDKFVSLDIDVDLIIDATDNITSRVSIDNWAKSKNKPWIYGSVEGFYAQICFFDKSSFSDSFNIKEHTPIGITPPMVMQIASIQANFALRYLANLKIDKDKLYYIFYNDDGELITQSFRMKVG